MIRNQGCHISIFDFKSHKSRFDPSDSSNTLMKREEGDRIELSHRRGRIHTLFKRL